MGTLPGVNLVDITAQKQLEAQLQAHNQQLALLAELSNLLAQSGHDYQALPTVAVRTIANALNGGCLLRLLAPDGEWLEADECNITRRVTHWMRLPKPPRGGASDA